MNLTYKIQHSLSKRLIGICKGLKDETEDEKRDTMRGFLEQLDKHSISFQEYAERTKEKDYSILHI